MGAHKIITREGEACSRQGLQKRPSEQTKELLLLP